MQALSLVSEWAFATMGWRVNSSLISTTSAHKGSAERCGFGREGVLRAWEPVKDKQPDVVMWSRLVSDPAPDLGQACAAGTNVRLLP